MDNGNPILLGRIRSGNAPAGMARCHAYSSKPAVAFLAPTIHERGYAESGRDLSWKHKATNIVTNPPYNSAGFVGAGLQKASRKLALLLRLAFLEGNRANTLFAKTPPARVW
jgi:hypothetical protein